MQNEDANVILYKASVIYLLNSETLHYVGICPPNVLVFRTRSRRAEAAESRTYDVYGWSNILSSLMYASQAIHLLLF